MYKIIIFSIVLFTPFLLLAQGNRINVPDDFAKIQDAINSSVDGDTIIVAPGTYFENVNFRGKNILLTSNYLFDEDVSFINTTIIDGSNPQYPDTASVVLFLNEENNSAILQGFTITGGKGSILFDPEKNYFVRTGGGINIYRSSPTIRHNIISFNEANNTGGIHWGGGGISAQNSGAIVSNNIIYNNDAPDGGGVLLGENPGAIFRNNVIAYNTNSTTSLGGGGVLIRGTQGRFINNTIAFNHSNIGGGILLHRYPTTFNVENCIIYGNTTGSTNKQIAGLNNIKITNSNIEGGWAGDGNIDENPLFIENTALILQDGSPCIDKGDTSTASNDWEDPDNPGFALSPALGTLRNDMGAYGGNQYKSMPFTSLEITGIKDENETIPDKLILRQNYPNPFNPATTISYSISEPATISLKVYDILGKEIKTLVNGYQMGGKHTIVFDARNFASGVYYYKLQAGSFSHTRKMILVR